MSRDPRIDAYIAKAQPFAQPILEAVRARVHALVPGIEEAMKWSHPTYLLDGRILLGTAAFKAHAALNFWRGKEIAGIDPSDEGMGQFGRLTSVDELPANLDALILAAAALPPKSAAPRPPKPPKAEATLHPDFAAALADAPAAKATLDGFAPGQRREYLDWINEAKRDDTRAKRIATALEWLAEGKKRNWKYENC